MATVDTKELKKPIANSMIVLREEFDDWAILFDPDSGQAFGVNPVSVMIWKLLDGKNSIEDIIKMIRERCSGVSNDAEAQVNDFVNQLIDRGFAGYEVK